MRLEEVEEVVDFTPTVNQPEVEHILLSLKKADLKNVNKPLICVKVFHPQLRHRHGRGMATF